MRPTYQGGLARASRSCRGSLYESHRTTAALRQLRRTTGIGEGARRSPQVAQAVRPLLRRGKANVEGMPHSRRLLVVRLRHGSLPVAEPPLAFAHVWHMLPLVRAGITFV